MQLAAARARIDTMHMEGDPNFLRTRGQVREASQDVAGAQADFKQALNFVNRVGAIDEEEGHHPDILLTWGKAEITLWTHSIGGLSESDFILAAKIDKLNA